MKEYKMSPELIANACQQYNMVLQPGEKMVTEIVSQNRVRAQRTTFEKRQDNTFLVTFEKPGCEVRRYSYPPFRDENDGF